MANTAAAHEAMLLDLDAAPLKLVALVSAAEPELVAEPEAEPKDPEDPDAVGALDPEALPLTAALDSAGREVAAADDPDTLAAAEPLALDAAVEADADELLNGAAIAKGAEVAKIWLWLPISMASRVYPSPTGTAGSVRVRVPAELLTGFAIAKLLLNAEFTRNNDQLVGSPAAGVQEIVAGLALCKSVGVVNVMALATEDKRATAAMVDFMMNVE